MSSLIILFLFIIPSIFGCKNDFDCNLGGRCNLETEECNCSTEWTGEDCGIFDLLPAELDNGFQPVNSSSWGGKIIKGASGEYHLYAAKMDGNCGLHSWRDNSMVAHAVSKTKPTGPYFEVDTVVDTFSHNPTAEHFPDNWIEEQYIMWHIGCGHNTTTPVQCVNGTTPESLIDFDFNLTNQPQELNGGCDNPHWTGMQISSTPEGPWTSVTPADQSLVIVNPNPEEESWHTKGEFTNPSIWPCAGGVLVMAYATSCPKCEQSPGNKHIGVAVAETFNGPYIDVTPKEPVFPFASEDPVIYYSKELGYWHILAHSHSGSGTVHAFATQPDGPWTISSTPPMSENIEWTDGTVTKVKKRERPQVIFIDGVPSLLVNGVEPGNVPTPFTPYGYTGDWSYTHVQAIRT